MAVILKNNKPRYVVVGFNEYEDMQAAIEESRSKVTAAAEAIMDKYDEMFKELAK